MYINAPTLSQLAACEAFSCDEELQANLKMYTANREVVLSSLQELGLGACVSPADGAFYVYLDLSSQNVTDAPALCKRCTSHHTSTKPFDAHLLPRTPSTTVSFMIIYF